MSEAARTTWYMTDEEIKVMYRQAKNRKEMVGIIADMNVRSKAEVKAKLLSLGIDPMQDEIVKNPSKAFQSRNKHGYTQKDVDVIKALAASGMTQNQMYKALHIGQRKIKRIMEENGIPQNTKRGCTPWPPERVEQLHRLVREGYTNGQIARKMGYSHVTIWQRRKRYGI